MSQTDLSPQSSKTQLLLVFLGTLALGVLLEGALRVAHVRHDATFYTGDPQLGWTLRPGAEGWLVSEGTQFIRINSAGLHDREHNIPKPAGTLRIAVLGNSWTEAMQVPLERNFCAVLERQLAACSQLHGRRVEVINFGVSGYSTAQELLLLRERVWKYEPDLVILAFYTARDIVNNVRQYNNAAAPEQSPYFVYSGSRLILDASFRNLRQVQPTNIMMQNLRGQVASQCRLYESITYITRHWKVRAAQASLAARQSDAGTVSLDDAIYIPTVDPKVESAWQVTEGLVSLIHEDVRSHGAAFWIVTLANRAQVNFDASKRRQALQKLGIPDFNYPDRRIQALAREQGIPYIALAPPLREYAEREKAYLNGFKNTAMGEGHWNELGHRLAGEAIAARLCTSLASDREALISAHPSTRVPPAQASNQR